MVRAILDGRKTQTRRVIKQQPDSIGAAGKPWWNVGGYRTRDDASNPLRCPYGGPGDRLWVRETWASSKALDGVSPRRIAPGFPREFKAGGTSVVGYDRLVDRGRWRPSIHMPRIASRITLEVTGVRAQRVHDISEADARAEGVEILLPEKFATGYVNYLWHGRIGRGITGKQSDAWEHQYSDYTTAIGSFSSLWESINGPRGHPWAANPWVWALEFRLVKEDE